MKSKLHISVLSLLIACSLFVTAFASTMGDGYVMIVNEANPTAQLTASQVKLIYLRKINKRWKELSKNIVPVDNKSNTECRKIFLGSVLSMTSDEMGRFFTEREYQNAEAPQLPKGFQLAAEINKQVARALELSLDILAATDRLIGARVQAMNPQPPQTGLLPPTPSIPPNLHSALTSTSQDLELLLAQMNEANARLAQFA